MPFDLHQPRGYAPSMPIRPLLLLAATWVAQAGCRSTSEPAPDADAPGVAPALAASAPASRAASQEGATTERSTLKSQIDDARVDLAERLGVSSGDIEVMSAEHVTWRNGALGCPQPSGLYTQALIEGARVILRHRTLDYAYHSGSDGQPFLCMTPEDSPSDGAVR